jgi:hypothetical protein
MPGKLSLADGSAAMLTTLTAEFEEFIREALNKAIPLARDGRLPTNPDEWDDLTLGVLPRHGKNLESNGGKQRQVRDAEEKAKTAISSDPGRHGD